MKILICEDESVIAEIVNKLLYKQGHIIYLASSRMEAIEMIKIKDIDIVITDYNLAIETQKSFVQVAKEVNPEIKIILLSFDTDYKKKLEEEMQACHFIHKPFSGKELEQVIDSIRSKAA